MRLTKLSSLPEAFVALREGYCCIISAESGVKQGVPKWLGVCTPPWLCLCDMFVVSAHLNLSLDLGPGTPSVEPQTEAQRTFTAKKRNSPPLWCAHSSCGTRRGNPGGFAG